MSRELRDLAKKVMKKVEEAVDREDQAFKKALGFIREEIKAILGNEGDDSVGEAQSPNPTVAAPVWAHMGGPQPASATSPNAPTRQLNGDQGQYSDQMPGNGVPDLADGQEPSAQIPNAQAPISGETVAAIASNGGAATTGLGTEMAHVADSDAQPEESATTIAPSDVPKPESQPIVAANESAVPDSGADAKSDGQSAPLPSEKAIQGADAGTAVSDQKEAEAAGSPEAGPLAETASDSANSGDLASGQPEAENTDGLPKGGNSPETVPMTVADEKEAEDEKSDESGEAEESDDSSDSEDNAQDPAEDAPKPKKRGRPKKNA